MAAAPGAMSRMSRRLLHSGVALRVQTGWRTAVGDATHTRALFVRLAVLPTSSVRWAHTQSQPAAEPQTSARGSKHHGRKHADATPKQTIEVKEFADVRTVVKQALLRMHPDVMSRFSPAVRVTNEKAVQDLVAIMDGMELRHKGEAVTPATGELQPHTHLSFFVADSTSQMGIRRVEVLISIPPWLDARTKANKLPAGKAQELWLAMGVSVVRKLASGIRLPLQVQGPDFDKVSRGMYEKSQDDKTVEDVFQILGNPKSWHRDLKNKLLDMSPIVQGKGDVAPPPMLNTMPVLGMRYAQRRIQQLMHSGRVSIDPTLTADQQRVAGKRLLKVMLASFDALYLHHDVWNTASLVLGRRYHVNPKTYTFTVPHDFSDEDLSAFIHENYDTLWKKLLRQVRVQLRDQKRAAAASKAPRTPPVPEEMAAASEQ